MRKLRKAVFPALLVLVEASWILPTIASAQVEDRVVHVLYPNDCPIEIRALKVAERPIEPQKPFAASEDWLKSLSWEIENAWEKSAAYVEIDLDFHELATQRDRVFKYQYGRRTNTPGVLDETELLRPGQQTRVVISDEEYVKIKRFIETRQANFSPSIVEMKVTKVVFEDGTVWPRREKSGVFGYFVCPVLIGDRIVAALDLKTDRQRQKLLVQRWNWVGRVASQAHRQRVETALHTFEQFQLCRS